jgi:hypothetical protein
MNNAKILANAVLLFWQGGPWTAIEQAEWERLTGTRDATSRTLCLLSRRVLDPDNAENRIKLGETPLMQQPVLG